MKKNRLNVNPANTNNIPCLSVYWCNIKQALEKKIASIPCLSMMIDGNTDLSTRECEIVYAQVTENPKLAILMLNMPMQKAGHVWVISVKLQYYD